MAAVKPYSDQLNTWHLELAIVQEAISRVISDLSDYDDALAATGHVLKLRLLALVESCPFPPCESHLPEPVPDLFEPDFSNPDFEAQALSVEMGWRGYGHD